MNKKIILVVAILLIVAVVFVACKGKGDVDETTESTTESTTETTTETTTESAIESTTGELIIGDMSDEDFNTLIPGVIGDGSVSGEGDIYIGGESDDASGEDSIGWDEIIGN